MFNEEYVVTNNTSAWRCRDHFVYGAMGPANERRRYIVTSSLIGWVHTQNDRWRCYHIDCLFYVLMAVTLTSLNVTCYDRADK